MFALQYVTEANFDRHDLQPVELLHQALSGLAHLHSLNIGKFYDHLLMAYVSNL